MWLLFPILLFNILLGLGAWLFARFVLGGEDLSRYDQPGGELVTPPEVSTVGREAVLQRVEALRRATAAVPFRKRLGLARELADQGFAGTPSDPARLGVEVVSVDAGGVASEWVCAPGGDGARRLLYIHGGAFTLGSASSHRAVTSALARRTGCAVLVINYRLMPEHGRLDGLEDCRSAYRWMLEHGPDGAGPVRDIYVAGDSAGGNLCLVLLAWIRDRGLPAPNAAVALSPGTDGTYQSPSLRSNIDSDVMLGPSLGRIMRMPRWILTWMTVLTTRHRPTSPLLSPLRGSLRGLAPTLVQASNSEMLRDDARRYVNKACAEGALAELELWPDMVHVWQLFEDVLPEAGAALDSVAEFLARHRSA